MRDLLDLFPPERLRLLPDSTIGSLSGLVPTEPAYEPIAADAMVLDGVTLRIGAERAKPLPMSKIAEHELGEITRPPAPGETTLRVRRAYDAEHPEFAARAERAKRGAAGPLGAESADPADTAADQRNGDADARLEAEARVVQEEFWRVVETDVESVRVEYGSDLDADVYGTGFAATVPPIGDPEPPSHHAWDFNELIHHPSNLLRVVGSDVPGLTRPWLYFGMLFSAFCWHVEDHYLGSVNYLHAGAPKTWYGIPSASADAFAGASRQPTVPR